MKDYDLRLRQLIPESHPVIVGISLGGMMASEMAKADKEVIAIIISSNKTSGEFPRYLKWAKYIPLYKLIPEKFLYKMVAPFKGILGARGNPQKALLKQIIKDADPHFTKWAIHAILHWQSTQTAPNIIHIHGTADKLLPYRLVKADYTIENGGHVMPMDHYQEISVLLKKSVQ